MKKAVSHKGRVTDSDMASRIEKLNVQVAAIAADFKVALSPGLANVIELRYKNKKPFRIGWGVKDECILNQAKYWKDRVDLIPEE